MPVRQSAAIRAERTRDRFVDLEVSIRLADVDGAGLRARWREDTDEDLVIAGGVWDRRRKRWVRNATASTAMIYRVHRGQEEAARWLAAWLLRTASGDWSSFARVWTALLIGGRRSGKSFLAIVALIAFAVLAPKSIVWCISPTLESGAELDRALQDLLPRSWYRRKEAATGSALTYTLVNGTRIYLRSGFKVATLRAGRADFVLCNEMQAIDERAYVNVRGAVVDTGGLVVGTANPPDEARGRYVEKLHHAALAGHVDAVTFELDPRRNPFIEQAALTSLEKEVDEKTYARDVLGLFPPIGDVVFFAWDDRENWRDPWPELVDVTAEVTRRALGRAAGDVMGQDYQRIPSMVSVVLRLFRDPRDASGEVLAFVVDECIEDDADEGDLLDALEAMPRWQPGDGDPDRRAPDRARYRGWIEPGDSAAAPAHACVIADASGFFQDGAHTPGRTSDTALRSRRWTQVYKPQADSDKNPAIVERMKAGNARLKAASGSRRLFVARHCRRVAQALREYPLRKGVPDRRHELAHIVDAVTYPLYRLFGRPRLPRSEHMEYRSVGKGFDRHKQLGGLPVTVRDDEW